MTAPEGVWLTHKDGADPTPFRSEIAALRDAIEGGKKATFVEFGKSLTDALAAPKPVKKAAAKKAPAKKAAAPKAEPQVEPKAGEPGGPEVSQPEPVANPASEID